MTKSFQHLPARTALPNIFINSTFNSKKVCLTPAVLKFQFCNMIYGVTNHQRQPVCWVAGGAESMGRGQG